jgi:origin recognition complex subunit 1
MLEKRFTTPSPRRIQTVLLVDELDILCNRRQDVVYNLLNWPTLTAARLVVITIANTMDLPERLLMGEDEIECFRGSKKNSISFLQARSPPGWA